jgi:hypothetical protein
MGEPRCADCRYWDREEGFDGWGLCALLSDAGVTADQWGMPPVPDRPVRGRDGDGTWFVIETHPEFYCARFSARQEESELPDDYHDRNQIAWREDEAIARARQEESEG